MLGSGPFQIKQLKPSEFPRTWEVLRAGIEERVTPGIVAAFWQARAPEQMHIAFTGLRREIPSPLPMEADTVFDLASVSKVFGTAALVATFIERRWISWNTDLQALLPDYPYARIQLRHLLSHTSGLPAWFPFYERIRERFRFVPDLTRVSICERQKVMRELVYAVPPEVEPGRRAVYSDLSFLLLGFAMEELTGMPLDRAIQRFVWQPMGIEGAFYRRTDGPVMDAVLENVAATEKCPWRSGVLQGQVHDDNCWSMGGYAGHAGAFGTASDLLLFARRLMSGYFSTATLETLWQRVSEPEGCERTAGWDTPSGASPAAGNLFSRRTVGHNGFTGTSLWIDRDAGLAVALLTNRVHPSRDNDKIKAFRPRFHDALRADLSDLPR